MRDVEFTEEESFLSSVGERKDESPPSGFSALLIKMRLAKDLAGANVLLGIILIVSLVLTATIILFVFS
jgi:hypothetical protein